MFEFIGFDSLEIILNFRIIAVLQCFFKLYSFKIIDYENEINLVDIVFCRFSCCMQ